jgi:DNA-binding NarL/FixJ family response regulator
MSIKVLIVDDSKLARMSVAKALNASHPDWIRIEATNADEAMELARRSPVDVALLDFNMPGRDGLVLAAELRALYPELPVAVISANHQVEVVNRAHEAGASFLSKPLTAQVLNEFLDASVPPAKTALP